MPHPSEELYNIVTGTVAVAEQLSSLMMAASAVICLMDSKVRAAERDWSEMPGGPRRRLTSEAGRLGVAVLDLNKLIAGMMSATRMALTPALEVVLQVHGNEQRTGTMLADLGTTLQLIEEAQLVVHQNDRRVASCIDSLQAISQRRDLTSEVDATVRELMLRLTRHASAG